MTPILFDIFSSIYFLQTLVYREADYLLFINDGYKLIR